MTTLHNGLSEVKLHYLKTFIAPGTILDVGAGNCQYSEWIKSCIPDAQITAIDHIAFTPRTDISFECQNLEHPLPYNNESFDTIIAFDILEHINNVDLLIKELYRVTKPGGIIIGSVPHDNDQFLPAYNLTFYHRSDVTHKRYYLPETLTTALKKEGFSATQIWLEGGISPHVFAEFFPALLKPIIKKGIGLLRKTGLIKTDALKSDLFFIGYKK